MMIIIRDSRTTYSVSKAGTWTLGPSGQRKVCLDDNALLKEARRHASSLPISATVNVSGKNSQNLKAIQGL